MKLDDRLNPSGFSSLTPDMARNQLSNIDKIMAELSDITDVTEENNDKTYKIYKLQSELSGVSIDNFINILNVINNAVDKAFVDNNINTILYFIFVLDIVKREIINKTTNENYDKNIVSVLSAVVTNINDKFYNLNGIASNKQIKYAKMYLDNINNFICKVNNKINNDSNYDHKFVSITDKTNDINSVMGESCEYLNKFYNESDEDYLIAYIKKLPNFTLSIIDNPDSSRILKNVCEYYYNKLLNNITAVNMFKDSVDEVIAIVKNKSDENGDGSYNDILDYMCELSDNLYARRCNLNDRRCCDHSPLFEMGFGYIYDIIPSNIDEINSNNINSIGTAMVEAAGEYQVLDIMTEAFGRTTSNRAEMIQYAKDDIAQRKVYDKYQDKRRSSDDRYSRMSRAKDDMYSDYRDEKQYSKEKKREEKERKKNQTKTAWAQWKTMELTSPTVYSATRALKRLVSATAIGGVAFAAGFNPVFLPIIYLISRYLKDKSQPERTKLKIMQDIQHTTNIIESKIDQADRQGDMKQKYQLMRMRDKLNSQFRQMGFTQSGTGMGGMT